MIGHMSLGVADLECAARFYDAVLVPLGYVQVWKNPHGAGYGTPDGNDKLALFPQTEPSAPRPGFHVAFVAPDAAAVDAFHAAAMTSGGTDNGAPGLRADYGPRYYAAFVVDPDGYNIEAVCQ